MHVSGPAPIEPVFRTHHLEHEGREVGSSTDQWGGIAMVERHRVAAIEVSQNAGIDAFLTYPRVVLAGYEAVRPGLHQCLLGEAHPHHRPVSACGVESWRNSHANLEARGSDARPKTGRPGVRAPDNRPEWPGPHGTLGLQIGDH